MSPVVRSSLLSTGEWPQRQEPLSALCDATRLQFSPGVFSCWLRYARGKIFVKSHRNYFLRHFLRLQTNKPLKTCLAYIPFSELPQFAEADNPGKEITALVPGCHECIV